MAETPPDMKFYLSVLPPGKGLFPTDLVDAMDNDQNPNRIVNGVMTRRPRRRGRNHAASLH